MSEFNDFFDKLNAKFPDVEITFSHPRQKMPSEDIIKLEEETFQNFRNILNHIQPNIVFMQAEEDDAIRNSYGLGSPDISIYINGLHALNAQIWAGLQEEERDSNNFEMQQQVELYPIYEDIFEDSERMADILEEANGTPVDPVQLEKYDLIKSLVLRNQNLFIQSFRKDNIDYFSIREYCAKNGQEMTEPDGYSATLNFQDPDFAEKTRSFVAALENFADQFEFLEPMYHTLQWKYGDDTLVQPSEDGPSL